MLNIQNYIKVESLDGGVIDFSKYSSKHINTNQIRKRILHQH